MSTLIVLSVVMGVATLGMVALCVEPDEETILGRLSFFLIDKLPVHFDALLGKLRLRFIIRFFKWLKWYFCDKPNPVVQIMYLVLVLGGFGLFVLDAYPYLPNPYMAEYHKWNGYGLMVVCLFFFTGASFVSPGVINKDTVKLFATYKYDHKLYFHSECKSCLVDKLPRSKHCRVCDHCVARFDHHCIWLNQCVGERNYRWFMGYLISHSVLLIYGAVALTTILRTQIAEKKLLDAVFVRGDTGEKVRGSPIIVAQYLFYNNPTLVGLLLLTAVMGVVLTGFTCYHIHLAAKNVTTNENFKWSSLARRVEYVTHQNEYRRKLKEEHEAKGLIPRNSPPAVAEKVSNVNAVVEEAPNGDADSRKADEGDPYKIYHIPDDILSNSYDRGWRANLAEVIWPLSIRPISKSSGNDNSKSNKKGGKAE